MRKLGVIAIGMIVLGMALWIGGEMHYRNCVNAAVASTPAPERAKSVDEQLDEVLGGGSAIPDTSRERAVSACSRFPL